MISKIAYVALAAGLCIACNSNKVKVEGRFTGSEDKTILLEMVTPSMTKIIDSVKTNDKGDFRFSVELPDGEPTIYNLLNDKTTITLLLDKGDKVKVNSIYGLNYTISGSEGSELVHKLTTMLSRGAYSLDSIRTLYTKAQDNEALTKTLSESFSKIYINTKREHIKFIVENAKSLAGLYALYQRMPNDQILFNGSSDLIYFRMIADSLEVNHPTSPYLLALKKQLSSIDASQNLVGMINSDTMTKINYPEIDLPDMYGNKHKLSQLAGKTILLYFWSTAVKEAPVLNAEMKELYAEYGPKGLEIYQVCIDNDKSPWVLAVQNQKLPWINVIDTRGNASSAVKSYNITQVPTSFLIDASGNINSRNTTGAELKRRVAELTK